MARYIQLKNDRRLICAAATLLGEAFALGSVLSFIIAGNTIGALQSLESIVLLLVPMLLERLLNVRFARWLYIYASFYCLGPLLGHSYRLFYSTVWWDKLSHFSAGVLFAVVGMYIPKLLNGGKEVSPGLRIIFALCFTITASALWEIVEYADDRIFNADTQNDTYITEIHTYLLNGAEGTMTHIENIESVVVNGIELPGYIDIGIIDTMRDIIVETLGGIIVAIVFAIDKGRHPAVRAIKQPETKNAEG